MTSVIHKINNSSSCILCAHDVKIIDINMKGSTLLMRKYKSKILDDYETYLSIIQEKSIQTIKGYILDIEIFIEYLKEQDKFKNLDFDENFIKEIELSDIYGFLNYLKKDRDNCANTRARKIASIKSFFKYCINKAEIITNDPTSKLEIPKIPKKQIHYLTLEECEVLLEKVIGRNKERDYAILTVFLNTGVRLSELRHIEMSKIKNDTLIVRGKGDKERTVYLNDMTLQAIKNYEVCRKGKSKYLFLSERGNVLSKREIQYIVQKNLDAAGLDTKKYTTHKLRHTAATLLYKHSKVDIRTLQVILGHKNINTTQIYTHVDSEDVRTAIRSNPLNRKNR